MLHCPFYRSQTDRHPFNVLFSRTAWVSQYQKGFSNLDFNEARDNGVAEASAGPYANHLHLVPDKLPLQDLVTQFFTGWMLFLMPNQQCQNTEGKPLDLVKSTFEVIYHVQASTRND